MKKIAVIDFETTGLSPENSRAIEIAVVLISGKRVVSRFSSLINPGIRVPIDITQLTTITNAMVASAPPSNKVIREALTFIGDADLVAHNASFDKKFMEMEMSRAGLSRPLDFVCTMLLARRVFSNLPNHKLGTLVDILQLPNNGGFHRALADAEATAELLFRIRSEISARHGLEEIPHSLLIKIQKVKIHEVEKVIVGFERRERYPSIKPADDKILPASTKPSETGITRPPPTLEPVPIVEIPHETISQSLSAVPPQQRQNQVAHRSHIWIWWLIGLIALVILELAPSVWADWQVK